MRAACWHPSHKRDSIPTAPGRADRALGLDDRREAQRRGASCRSGGAGEEFSPRGCGILELLLAHWILLGNGWVTGLGVVLLGPGILSGERSAGLECSNLSPPGVCGAKARESYSYTAPKSSRVKGLAHREIGDGLPISPCRPSAPAA